MKSRVRSALAMVGTVALAASTAAILTTGEASAAQPSDPGPATLPSAVPSATTPNVDNGGVFAIAQSGSSMVIGGTFTSVAGKTRQHVAAFDKTTGALSSGFAPAVDGDVNAVIPGPASGTVYVGGSFKNVNGTARQFLALVNLTNGSVVSTFKPPAFNYGRVNDLVLRGSKLYVAGVFTKAGGTLHQGLIAVNASTGALDPSVNVQFTGHHNDTGSGTQAAVGPTDIDVTADGRTLVAIGNFKFADGMLRDQVALIDLTGATAVTTTWSTTAYSPYCNNWAIDHYVRGVALSPDGSFFAISTTGGPHAGTLCDATARFEVSRDANVRPTWIDETGGDTLWGITVTNTAVYTGGHSRWANNPYGADTARAGAVPRPGMVALDVATGRPFSWNPGHVPLGLSSYAFLGTADGVWMGYDQDYIGNHKYRRQKLAFFPYAGGYTPASTTTQSLPGNVFLAGRVSGANQSQLNKVAYDGASAARSSAVDPQAIDFVNWRGAFQVGNRVYYGYADKFFYYRTFNGTTFGPANRVDPYNDPTWSNVVPYSGSPALRGVVPTLYSLMPYVSAMAYVGGRLYFTVAGDSRLFSKWFLPDSGVMDETTAVQSSSVNLSAVDGMFVSGGNLYFGSWSDGNLRRVAFNGGNPTGAAAVVSGPALDGVNWQNRAMFIGR